MKTLTTVLITICAITISATAVQAAKKYIEAEVANGGTISGQVKLGSAETESQTFTIAKNPEVCGTGERVVEWVRANGEGLLDAVVYLEDIAEGKPFTSEAAKVSMDQKGCRFLPFVQVLTNEGDFEAKNSDPVLHNIHTYELIKKARRTVFNVSQPEEGHTFNKQVKLRRGHAMKVECDAHDFMHAWVFVARNPYYALVDDNGGFSIGDVPPGDYTLKVWHGRLGEVESAVTVEAGGTIEVDLAY